MGNQKRRVVVTGVGPITPVGIGKEAFWESLIRGRSAFRRIDFPGHDMGQYRSKVAAPIEGFDLSQFVHPARQHKHMGRTARFAIAAASLALGDAGIQFDWTGDEKEDRLGRKGQYQLRLTDPFRIGVILGIGVEAMDLIEENFNRFNLKGPRGISPFALPNIYMSAITSHVAQSFSIRGTSYAVSTACASGTHAMINSLFQIQSGREDLMLTGGADACITPYVFAGFDACRAMSTRNDRPERASRPFDRERDGFVMGEGAGLLLFEELEHARRRGARLYAEVVGFGMTADAHHLTDPDPEGNALGKALRDALEIGGLAPEEIDYINPHGSSTPQNDRVETKVIKNVFGERAYTIPISATKSITGHLMGAAGGVEAITVLLTIERGVIHPTMNYEVPDPDCDLDYVPNEARKEEVRTGLSISAGFGGVNSAILFKKIEG